MVISKEPITNVGFPTKSKDKVFINKLIERRCIKNNVDNTNGEDE